jgi:hypothetical protein
MMAGNTIAADSSQTRTKTTRRKVYSPLLTRMIKKMHMELESINTKER